MKRIISIALALCAIVVLLVGCKPNVNDTTKPLFERSAKTDDVANVNATMLAESIKNESHIVVDEAANQTTVGVKNVADEETQKLAFVINGMQCYLGMEFSTMLSQFQVDMTELTDDDLNVIDPKCRLYLTIYNECGEQLDVSLYNDTDETLSYENCKIEEINCNAEYIGSIVVIVSGNELSYNSSVEDFVNVFGEWCLDAGTDEFNIYAWEITNNDDQISVYLLANPDTATINNIKVVLDSIV